MTTEFTALNMVTGVKYMYYNEMSVVPDHQPEYAKHTHTHTATTSKRLWSHWDNIETDTIALPSSHKAPRVTSIPFSIPSKSSSS